MNNINISNFYTNFLRFLYINYTKNNIKNVTHLVFEPAPILKFRFYSTARLCRDC